MLYEVITHPVRIQEFIFLGNHILIPTDNILAFIAERVRESQL